MCLPTFYDIGELFQMSNIHINVFSYSTSDLKTNLNLFSYIIKIKRGLFCIFQIGMQMELIFQGGERNQGVRKWWMMPEICWMLLGQKECLSKGVWEIDKAFQWNTAEEKSYSVNIIC